MRTYLSLQLPGWPTPLVQRMMMFWVSDIPAQNALALRGQMNALLVEFLWTSIVSGEHAKTLLMTLEGKPLSGEK